LYGVYLPLSTVRPSGDSAPFPMSVA
jgi:hypothetical protein